MSEKRLTGSAPLTMGFEAECTSASVSEGASLLESRLNFKLVSLADSCAFGLGAAAATSPPLGPSCVTRTGV